MKATLDPIRVLPRALLALLLVALSIELSARTVDGGVDNSFAISKYDGTLWAWGGNVGGKLGNGTTIYTSMPVPVSKSVLLGLAAGFYHTCSWSHESGEARCWGLNISGQLGDGSNADRWQSVPVSGLSSGVTHMSLGTWHTCAVTTGGAVKCWGYNGDGQLGYAGPDANVPVNVPSLASGATAVSAGERHTCASTTSGVVKCWGNNGNGQLGNGNNISQVDAVDVSGPNLGMVSITSGLYHTCALTRIGEAKCWGLNGNGQLGNGTTTSSNVPVTPTGLSSGVVALAAGSYHTCAVLATGAVNCWGYNGDGQLGDGTLVQKLVPTTVAGLTSYGGVAFASAGFSHTCVLTLARRVLCWGRNSVGEVGDSTTTLRLLPTPTWYMGANVGTLISGGHHSCAIYKYPGNSGSYVFCWGQNDRGQLGINSTTNQLTPQFASTPGLYVNPLAASAVSAGMSHTLAIDGGGRVWAWGANNMGQLGVGKNRAPETCYVPFSNINCSTLPIRVPGLPTIVAVGAGWGHSIALAEDGSVWAWGDGQFGQIGDLYVTTTYAPTRVLRWDGAQYAPLQGISKIAAGYFHSLALDGNGALQAWGRNNHGQLGTGTFDDSWWGGVPVPGTYSEISAKGSHSLALTSSGTLYAWGLNDYGQVGNGSTFDVASPVSVRTGVTQISAGMTTSMIVGTSSPFAWGLNTAGQLGTSSFDSCGGFACQRTPRQLSGYSGAHGVAAAGAHGIVIRNDDTLALFGDNSVGQLGNPSGNFPGHFQQGTFDPLGKLFPAIAEGTGTSIGAGSTGTGLSLDNLGASIDFGVVGLGQNKTITLTLKNLDPTTITFSGISATSPFSIVSNGCTGTVAANGGSCQFGLNFAPTSLEGTGGTLEISSNAVDNETLRFGIAGAGAERPAPPTGATATAYDQYAVVKFNPAGYDGGAPISSYTVTASPGGATASGTPSSYYDGITVPGLTNGVAYTFTVTATNAANLTSVASAPSNSVTPNPPPSVFMMASNPDPPYVGSPVTFTVTLAGSSSTPTGTLTFLDWSDNIAGCESVPLVSGVAQCTTNLTTSGYHLIGATYSGSSTYSGASNSLYLLVLPALVKVTLSNSHGSAGFFEVEVDKTQPLGGAVTVDPRVVTGMRDVFFNFNGYVSSAGATITAGQVAPYSWGASGVRMSVQNVPNNTRVTITVTNINGTGYNAAVSLAFAVGDVDNSRSVTDADILALKSHAGEVATAANFRHDVNLSGAVTAADILVAKGRNPSVVP